MSAKAVEAEADVCCANCGVAEVDIKLKDCDGCDLVKYCSDKCTENHREQHDGECKKRAQEIHDDDLLRQPDDSHLGECPLCFLPMPLHNAKCTFYSCCSKLVCKGCSYADYKSNGYRCPFCREPAVDEEERNKRQMKRIEANDPTAMVQMGTQHYEEGDHVSAVEYWTKAAELGNAHAYYQLSAMYMIGLGIERDEEKAVYHLEKAAMGGHTTARHNLACVEEQNGNIERAVKHFIINANLGYEKSMKFLWQHYSDGNITKEELEATLRTHKAALDEIKSPERAEAEAAYY